MPRAFPLLLLMASAAVPAQSRIDWHTVDGGGGVSQGGRYTLQGTAAQPDADEVSMCSPDGGASCVQPRFELTGGYWTGNVPGSPPPRIFRDGFEP